MDAEQRSVFQGIVYYYRENMVNCRYQVTLKDAVDGALLQQALDAARAKAPYYFQKPVWEKKLLHLEPSDAPCPVRQGSAKPEFPDENGFTVALSYEGKVVYFDWFHFLADGRGIAPFMTMVLQFYCNLRYGTAFEGQTLETDPAYDIEDILAKYPESQVANDMQRPVVQTFEETPTCCRVRLEKAGLVDAALRCGVKPFSTLTALLCKAVRAYLDKDEVLYSYSTDARDALGAPNALYNCVASFQRKLPLTADAPLAEVAVGVDADLKENLSAERKLFRIAEQMGWVYRVYQQKASLSIKKRIFQMGEYISGFPADFWVSYLGDPFAPSSPELTRYIEDFQTWVPADGASIGLECTSLHGIITLCVKNKVPRPGFAEALRAAFEAEGIKVLEAAELGADARRIAVGGDHRHADRERLAEDQRVVIHAGAEHQRIHAVQRAHQFALVGFKTVVHDVHPFERGKLAEGMQFNLVTERHHVAHQLLVGFALGIVVLDVGDTLNGLAVRPNIGHPAGRILRSGLAERVAPLDIAFVVFGDSPCRIFSLVFFLVEDNEFAVCAFQRQVFQFGL